MVTLLCELPAALSSVTAAHRGPLLLKQAMSLRGGEDSQSFPAVGSEEGVEKLKAVMSAACDPTQTAEQQAASKASILDMVSERWGQLPKDKQADLKRFALQQLSSGNDAPSIISSRIFCSGHASCSLYGSQERLHRGRFARLLSLQTKRQNQKSLHCPLPMYRV